MTAPGRAALGERAARALEYSLTKEPHSVTLERVTTLLVAVQEEERERCAKKADAEKTWACSVVAESDGQDGKREHGYRCRAAAAHDIARDIRARGAESKTPTGRRSLGRTLFECRTCDRVMPGWTDGQMDDSSWARIDHIDGPNAICPSCQGDVTALDGLRENYPNAVVCGTESKTGGR